MRSMFAALTFAMLARLAIGLQCIQTNGNGDDVSVMCGAGDDSCAQFNFVMEDDDQPRKNLDCARTADFHQYGYNSKKGQQCVNVDPPGALGLKAFKACFCSTDNCNGKPAMDKKFQGWFERVQTIHLVPFYKEVFSSMVRASQNYTYLLVGFVVFRVAHFANSMFGPFKKQHEK